MNSVPVGIKKKKKRKNKIKKANGRRKENRRAKKEICRSTRVLYNGAQITGRVHTYSSATPNAQKTLQTY